MNKKQKSVFIFYCSSESVLKSLSELFEKSSFSVTTSSTKEDALLCLQKSYDVLMLEYKHFEKDCLLFIKKIITMYPESFKIIVSSKEDVSEQFMQENIYDENVYFIQGLISPREIRYILQKTL